MQMKVISLKIERESIPRPNVWEGKFCNVG